jgi:predicted N-acetyltransferase YhbS
VIRPAGPADTAAIEALAAAYREELDRVHRPYCGGPVEAWRSWLDRRLSAGDVRVALSDGRTVGYVIWEVRRAPERPGRALRVTDLYVAPGRRGQRLGGGLLARALDRARVDGLDGVRIDVGVDDRAEALLDAFGFASPNGDAERFLPLR